MTGQLRVILVDAMYKRAACWLCVCLLVVPAMAEDAHLSFDVASIKPGGPGIQSSISWHAGGRFVAQKATLKTLVSFAWDMNREEIIDGPKWMDEERFDIEARQDAGTAPAPTDDENTRRIRLMLRDLLASRFGLKVRNEARNLPVYDLVVPKTGITKDLHPNDGTKDFAIFNRTLPEYRKLSEARFAFQKVTMDQFAYFLCGVVASDDLGRPVINKTGLKGEYDCYLTWLPLANVDRPEASGPSIFTAIQEHLGLKLQASKGKVPVLVVNQATHPTDN